METNGKKILARPLIKNRYYRRLPDFYFNYIIPLLGFSLSDNKSASYKVIIGRIEELIIYVNAGGRKGENPLL